MIIIQKSDQPTHKYRVKFQTFGKLQESSEGFRIIISTLTAQDTIQASLTAEDITKCTLEEQPAPEQTTDLRMRRRGTLNIYNITAQVVSSGHTYSEVEFELPAEILNGEYNIALLQHGTTKGNTLLRIEENYQPYKENKSDRIIKE